MTMESKISIIAAIGRNRELGKGNELLWRIPDDLKRFKELTTGHPVIMGRKTFDSIGKPLPNRTNIVVTRDGSWTSEGTLVAHSLDEAFEIAHSAPGSEAYFVIGGAQMYAEALSLADTLYLTLIDARSDADAFFPEYREQFTCEVSKSDEHAWSGLKYRWVTLTR